jgi:cell wall assembly regulator SMI1
VQKFTRPLTREIELAGQRLALTFTETGLAIRTVGSRRAPHEVSWATLIHSLAGLGEGAEAPTDEDLAAAVDRLKSGRTSNRASNSGRSAADQHASAVASATMSQASPPADRASIAELLARLERWLTQHRPRYAKGLRPGASPEVLDSLQAQLGVAVPPDLRALLSWHNGQSDDFIGCFVESWSLMNTEQILAARRELLEPSSGFQAAWLPFLDDDGGNYVALDTRQSPAPVREFWAGKADQPTVAPSLTAWLADFVSAVERGEYQEDPERGYFLRNRE